MIQYICIARDSDASSLLGSGDVAHIDAVRKHTVEHRIITNHSGNATCVTGLRVCVAKELCKGHFKDDRHCVEVALNSGYQREDVLRRLQEVSDILGEVYAESRTAPTAVFVAEAVI